MPHKVEDLSAKPKKSLYDYKLPVHEDVPLTFLEKYIDATMEGGEHLDVCLDVCQEMYGKVNQLVVEAAFLYLRPEKMTLRKLYAVLKIVERSADSDLNKS